MKQRIKATLQRLCCHRTCYTGICGSYLHAAWSSGHPELYLPLAAFYGLLLWLG